MHSIFQRCFVAVCVFFALVLPGQAVLAPSAITVSPQTNREVVISWRDNAPDETGFEVELKVGTGAFQLIHTAQANPDAIGTAYYTWNESVPGTVCTFRVRAIKTGEAPSAYVTAAAKTIPAVVPPSLVKATNLSIGKIRLDWTDLNIESHTTVIEIKTGTGAYQIVETLPQAGTSRTWTWANANPGTAYSFRLKNLQGTSLFSSAYSTAVALNTPILPAPTALRGTVVSPTRVELFWTDNSTGESGFSIEAKLPTGIFTEAGTTPAHSFKSMAFKLDLPANLTTVSTRVRAFYTNPSTLQKVYSAYTATVVSTIPKIIAPRGIEALLGPTGEAIEVNWDDPSANETGFVVEASINGGGWQVLGNTGAGTSTSFGITWSRTAPTAHPLGGLSYRFRVRGFITAGTPAVNTFSAYSPISKAVLMPKTLTFSAPSGLVATAANATDVNFKWVDNANTNDGTEFFYRVFGAPDWTSLGKLSSPTATTVGPVQNLLEAGKLYEFRIQHYKITGNPPVTTTTAFSNIAQLKGPERVIAFPGLGGRHGDVLTLTYPGNRTEQTLTGLPANFTFDPVSGLVTGTVQGTGILSATYTANVSGHGVITQTLFLRGITATDNTEVLGTGGTVGETVVHTILTTNPTTRTSQTLVGLPAGITFNATTGVVSGLLTTPGNFTATYTATYTDGTKLIRPFSVRCIRRPAPPAIAKPILAWQSTVGKTRDTPLAGVFTDADTEAAVRVSTNKGDMNFILYPGATPGTVKNFLNYVKSGRYTDVIFHRSVSNFVIQGGAFRSTGLDNDILATPTDPQIKNEAGLRNLLGSISMAKLGGNPDSATNQFFVSNNDNQENLDNQNGGFSVFGRVAGNGMSVANAINALPTKTYSLEVDSDGNTNNFADFPVDAAAAPTTYDPSLNVKILSATQLTTFLTYSITGNTNPAVASATIINGVLRLRGLTNGTTTVTLTATDLDGNTRPHDIVIAIGVPLPPPAALSIEPTPLASARQLPVAAPVPETAIPSMPVLPENSATPPEAGTIHPVDAELGVISAAESYATVAFVLESGFAYTVKADGETIWSSNSDGPDSPLLVSAMPSPTGVTMVVIRDSEPLSSEPPRQLTVEASTK